MRSFEWTKYQGKREGVVGLVLIESPPWLEPRLGNFEKETSRLAENVL